MKQVSGLVERAREEHGQVRTLIGQIEGRDPTSAEFEQHMRKLQQALADHIGEEEGQMFVQARAP